MIDLTKQRRLQGAEQKLREWEARHLLINRLAHEINNPLAALTFSIHLFSSHADLSSDAHKLIQDAVEMLDRIAESVRMVLMESRPLD
jgi:nitrogen-specific signal transduction histidine kinase